MALRVIGGEVTAYVGLIDIMLLRDVKIKSRAENSKKISGFCNEIFLQVFLSGKRIKNFSLRPTAYGEEINALRKQLEKTSRFTKNARFLLSAVNIRFYRALIG